jgi:hypothetical protein
MKPSVWVVKRVDCDLSKVADFGKLRIAFPETISPLDTDSQRELVFTDVLTVAKKEDFILTAGPAIMVVNFSLLWSQRFGSCNFLVWDNRRKQYKVKHFS